MFVVNHRKIFFAISSLFGIAAIVAMIVLGFNLSIEFTGGSILEVEYMEAPELNLVNEEGEPVEVEQVSEVRPTLDDLNALFADLSVEHDLGPVQLQPAGDAGLIVRTKTLGEDDHKAILTALEGTAAGGLTETRFSSIGPSVGAELRTKALTSIIIVIILIILFIAYAFRHVSKEVSSFKYGLIAIIALVHDILIPTGVFVILGHLYLGFQIDTLFVSAILAILGYSVNDTIVVFDRVRENLKDAGKHEPFAEVVGKSLNQTIARSINTSITTLLVLLALLFFGGESTRQFALVLAIGVISGTYSSIFLASPLLVALYKKD